MKFIVTAGGQGTKLWPYSREQKPKQFQTIVGEQSLYQQTIADLASAFSYEDIFVATKRSYVHFIQEQTPEVLASHIIAEPDAKKNQGPATAYAALKIDHIYPGEPFMVIQSDCLRNPREKFIELINECEKMVKTTRRLISGGMRPTYPALGIDYIELKEKFPTDSTVEFYTVNKFVDRLPTIKETAALIENFHVITHSNHHCWYAPDLLAAIGKHRPLWYEKLTEIAQHFGKDDEAEQTEKLYNEIEQGGNIEEVTRHIFEADGLMALLPYRWTDVGSWTSILDLLKTNDNNYFDGKVIQVDSRNTLVKADPKKVVGLLGVEDLIIVETPDALLIADQNQIGELNKILAELTAQGLQRYL